MQQKPPVDMAHVLGMFLEVGGTMAALLLSALLSWMFFSSITPPDLNWLPYAAMSLTEGGLLVWGGVFILQRYNAFKKSVAMVMSLGCGLASFIVAGSELDVLIRHTDISHDSGLTDGITNVLVVIFAVHLIMFMVSIFHHTLTKPGHEFRNPTQINYIPNGGNLIPTQSQHYNIEQENTGASQEIPLQAVYPVSLAQEASAGVSSLIKKVKRYSKRGKTADNAHGQMNETTSANT